MLQYKYGRFLRIGKSVKDMGVARALVLMLCLLLGSLLHAQNNPYGINDQLYAMYNKAYSKRFIDEGLTLANRMYADAVRLKDGKAQCLALSVTMLHYFYAENEEEKFRQAVKAMQDKAIETGYLQYYYFGKTNTVAYLLSMGRIYEAYIYVLEFEQETRKKNDKLGLFNGLNSLAQVYTYCLDFGSANKVLDEALEIGNEYLPDQDMATIYRKKCENYSFLFDYDSVERTAEQGLCVAKTKPTRQRLLYYLVFSEIKLEKLKEAREHCELYMKIYINEINATKRMVIDDKMLIMKKILDGYYAEALEKIKVLPSGGGRDSLRLQMMCSNMAGDYKLLSEQKDQFYKMWILNKDNSDTNNLMELNAMFLNQKNEMVNHELVLESQRLENQMRQSEIDNVNLGIANAQLSLRNSSLELGRTRTKAQMMRLQYFNKKLEADQLRIKIANQRAMRDTQNMRVGLVATAMLFILVLLLLYLHFHRKVTKHLNETHAQLERNHEELVEARNRAEAANRVKTTLIQNMESNVKESLDSITGFAMLIADNPINYTKEQKAEFYRHILKNTEQLLGVVNKVLKEAQKE